MYNKYLKYLMKDNPKEVISKSGIIIRKLFNPIFQNVIVPLSSKNKLIIEERANLPSGKPIIFAATHGFRDDVAFSLKTAGIHSYLLYASIPDFYYSIDGPALWTNGTIMLDRKDKLSRSAAKEKMKYALSLGTNILMYPEGVWNKTENLLVQKLFPGIYDVAKESGALVVPIATLLVGKYVYSIRGEAFDICEYDRASGLNVLRDKMATLKFNLIDKYSHISRSDIGDPGEYHDNYLKELIATANGLYDYEIENSAQYTDKNDKELLQYRNHMEKIDLCLNTAFLFNKRYSF